MDVLMKGKDLFTIGMALFFEQEKDSEMIRYRTKICDITDKQIEIEPLMNTENGREAIVVEGDTFTCFFVGKDQLYHNFPATIVKRKLEPFRSFMIDIPKQKELSRVQRREFVRVDVRIDAAVEINQQPFSLERMVTSDISGGGCSFVLPKGKYFFPGIIFDCCLALPYDKGMEFLNVKAKLVRIDLSSSPNRLCCKFIQISESERNQLTQFVFEQQVKRRNKMDSLSN